MNSRIILPAVLVTVIGGGIGLADFALRGDNVKLGRNTPPPPPPNPSPVVPVEPGVVKPADGQSSQAEPPTSQQPTPEPPAPTNTQAQPADVKPTPTAAEPRELPAGHITVAQAKGLFDQGAIFVDARRKDVYVEGHVAGAFRADMASFQTGDPQWVKNLPRDLTLVVYCSGGNCDESEHVAQLLEASGFTTIYVMHDGFPGWRAAGFEVETGEGQE